MKTALATLVFALVTPMAVTAAQEVPDSVMSEIRENCLEAVAGNSQATQSDENCIARAVEAYKKANP